MGTLRDLNELTVPAATDYLLVADTSDLTDKDKKMLLSRLAIKNGTPTAGHVAVWLDANNVQDGGVFAADQYLKTGVYLVDPNFTANAAGKRYTTISAAMAVVPAGGVILVAPGTYTETVTVSQSNVLLVGAGAPSWDGSNLSGGTILIGQINVNTKTGFACRDLGIDIRTTAFVDAIASGNAVTTAGYGDFRNLVCVGKGSVVSGDRGHGILCTSGGNNIVNACKFYSWYHGVGLRCADSTVSDCYFSQCLSDAVIIKGDTGSGNAWRNAVTNCVIDGDPASAYTRGGPMRIQNNNSATTTRYNVISNITANDTGEAVVLVQQVAGSCSNAMISNVIGWNGGDDPSRADFDVQAATDVHFSNCMSANRANGFGFRSTGSRVRALNCSSDSTGAGRVAAMTGFDYLDLGSGLGVDLGRFRNITFDDNTELVSIRRAQEICGGGSVASGATKDMLTLVKAGSGTTLSVAVNLTITSRSGAKSFTQQYHVSIIRPNATLLVAAVELIGTSLAAGSGSAGTVSITVDVATAETAKIQVTGAGGFTSSLGYKADIVCADIGAWSVQNSMN
jgi:hypothetical protein